MFKINGLFQIALHWNFFFFVALHAPNTVGYDDFNEPLGNLTKNIVAETNNAHLKLNPFFDQLSTLIKKTNFLPSIETSYTTPQMISIATLFIALSIASGGLLWYSLCKKNVPGTYKVKIYPKNRSFCESPYSNQQESGAKNCGLSALANFAAAKGLLLTDNGPIENPGNKFLQLSEKNLDFIKKMYKGPADPEPGQAKAPTGFIYREYIDNNRRAYLEEGQFNVNNLRDFAVSIFGYNQSNKAPITEKEIPAALTELEKQKPCDVVVLSWSEFTKITELFNNQNIFENQDEELTDIVKGEYLGILQRNRVIKAIKKVYNEYSETGNLVLIILRRVQDGQGVHFMCLDVDVKRDPEIITRDSHRKCLDKVNVFQSEYDNDDPEITNLNEQLKKLVEDHPMWRQKKTEN